MLPAIAGLIAFLGAAQDAPLPREMALDESSPKGAQEPSQERHPPAEPAPQAVSERPVVDLDWLELTPGVGFAVYSSNYRADPAPEASLLAHAPLPWLAPAGESNKEYFGVFFEAAFATIDRDLSPTVSHRSGVSSFFTLGLDYSFIRDNRWILVGRVGVLYAYYGGVADLKDGFGPMVGGTAGLQLSGALALTYSPELLIGGSGSLVFLNTFGLLIQF
jgi:hypothetical protein